MDNNYDNLMAKEDETIAEHTKKVVEQAILLMMLGYVPPELFYDFLVACFNHDIGKMNEIFQHRIHISIDENRRVHINIEEEVPHNILSMFCVKKELCIDYTSVCFAVLYHHYTENANYKSYVKEHLTLINEQLKQCGICEIPDNKASRLMDDIKKLRSLPLVNERKKYAVLLKGLLHKCDYSASAKINCENKNDFLIDCLDNWKNENNIKLNELQEFCHKNSGNDIIVTAPTGMGKTEAGLLWCGNNKCFFVLPLKTAINAMYQRVRALSGIDFKDRVALKHSDMMSFYLNNSCHNIYGGLDLEYCTKSKQLSLPITICTPDQIFDFVLQYAGYEYKLATASYSRFIIDEIQMYSPDLLAAIIYGIRMIHNMGGKFAILTATLPPFVKAELKEIFGSKVITQDFSEYGTVRHNVKVISNTMKSDFVLETVKKLKSDSVKMFLVVCNSIDTVQKLFCEMKADCPQDINIHVLHSQFIKRDRAAKEEQIIRAAKDRTCTEIWITTSVVEASLDIDFDILFTELSDLFSLFQRFGRVNRKGKKSIDSTNCFVFTELQGNAKRCSFTDKTVYELSKEALKYVKGKITEQKKTELIEDFLAVKKLENSDYVRKYRDYMNNLDSIFEYEKSRTEKLRSINTTDMIPEIVYKNNKTAIEESISIISDRSKSTEERLKEYDNIRSLTVSVQSYEKNNATNKIALSNADIPVSGSYDYDFEIGLVRRPTSKNNGSDSFDTRSI